MKFRISFYMAACMFLMPWAAQGQDAAKEEAKITTVKIVLHPMPETSPALKYQILPPLIDRKPGNAAVLYNRIPAGWYNYFDNDKLYKVTDLLEKPFSEMGKKDVRESINNYEPIIEEIIRAAHYEHCDWQLPLEQGFLMRLPELHQNRNYGKLLAVKARLQITDGKYDEALHTLQAGYALARHVATGPTLVNSLVGLSITGVTSDQVQEFIQQPDAPNLYWALSSLPTPIVDMRPGLEAERDGFYLVYPELRDLDKKNYTPEQWLELLTQTIQKLSELFKQLSEFNKNLPNIQIPNNPEERKSWISDATHKVYPVAKQFMTERGWSNKEIEAMPDCQVIMIAALRHFDEFRDDWLKAMTASLPFPTYLEMMQAYDRKFREFTQSGQELFSMTRMLAIPEIFGVKHAEVRIDRQLAILRVLEALRLYGASHDGKLAEKLSDIIEVPVPIDPVSGKPFIYQCKGNTATLESPSPQNLRPNDVDRLPFLRYEIQFVTKKK